MTAKHVRVKVSPAPSSTTATTTTTRTKSHCSRCSHCRDREARCDSRSSDHSTDLKPLPAIDRQAQVPETPLARARQPALAHDAAPPLYAPVTPYHSLPPHPGPIPIHLPHEPRLHPFAPAPVLHNLGRGPEPLFGWESVMPLHHTYGQPRYMRRTKPDYRRFCFSVGKADVPFAAMPGGPLWGMDVTMAPQLVGCHR